MGRRRANPNATYNSELAFPIAGLDESRSYLRQRDLTCADAQNVRAFEPGTDRQRGGTRGGTVRLFDDAVVGDDLAIQGIGHLITNGAPADPTTIGEFIYAGVFATDGVGFGLAGGSDGASDATIAGTSGYAFACSCWDDDGNVYVAEVNTSTGATRIHKRFFDSTHAGTADATWGTTPGGPVTTIAVTTGSLRKIAGMVCIGDFLYMAIVGTVGSVTNYIAKIKKTTGAFDTQFWYTNVAATGNANLIFSTGSINCLGKVGTLLGVDCRGTSTAQCFKILDTSKTTAAMRTAAISRPYTGTAANARSVVVGDGTAYFYVSASVTANKLKKIDSAGVILWNSAAFDSLTLQGFTYDAYLGVLVCLVTATAYLRTVSLSTGLLTGNTYTPGSQSWDWIDSDGQGFFTLWKDSAATNNAMGVNSTFSQVWALETLAASAVHSGASVNKGKVAQPTGASDSEVRLLIVSNGTCVEGGRNAQGTLDGTIKSLTNGASFSASAKFIHMAQQGQNMYFADGNGYWDYNGATGQIEQWTASAGSMPTDDNGHTAKLICNFLDRIVLGLFAGDSRNLYMSAIDAPRDWDTAPTPPREDQAIAIPVQDSLTCIFTFGDDLLIAGCDHSIVQVTGDPGFGGRIDKLSETLGIAFGRTHVIAPDHQLYFWGSQGGIYKMVPPSPGVVHVSQQIKHRLEVINLSTHQINMVWDIKNEGLAVYCTPYDETQDATNFFYDSRTQAWWPDFYSSKRHCVTAAHLFDGDDPSDLAILLGCRDGKVRILSDDETTDDGQAIEWFVVLGPMRTPFLDEIVVLDAQATLADASADCRYDVYAGRTPEAALALMHKFNGDVNPGVKFGTWSAARNFVSDISWAGYSVFVKVSGSDRTAIEKITCNYRTSGMVRRRG